MRYILLVLFIAFTTDHAAAQELSFLDDCIQSEVTVASDIQDDSPKGNRPSKAPIKKPTIGFDGNTVYLYGLFSEFTLELIDNGTIVYSTTVGTNTNFVILPDNLSGRYMLLLDDGRTVYSYGIEIRENTY